ncbi:MAG: SDR family NAD(P)-dependent oxidoreductase [Clostridiales bacterium]|nr:SDR family NAD(P)-dependent oxidoreductase [Clostridiales bacterium]
MNVMITGASGGLGRALANECGRRGYNLFLTDIDARGLKSIQRGVERQFNVTVTTAACDLTSDESVDELVRSIDSLGIRFDMLLNVAGVDYEGGFLERSGRDIVRIISLNNEATLRITHALLNRRREGLPFYLLFTSSLASMYPMPLKATYAASKRFLLDLAVALREELRDKRVNVLALCPGGLATTREAMRGIAAQGFWGSATTNPLEVVSRKTIDRLEARGGIYIPGALNRVLTFFGKLLPRRWVAAAIYRRWQKAQEHWKPAELSAEKL